MPAGLTAAELSAVAALLRGAGCVFAEDEAELLAAAASTAAELSAMAARRAGGLPLEQVLGWAEFCGLRIAVEPGVFVPRRRTECLAERARSLSRAVRGRSPVLLDLCCGAAPVAAAVAAAVPGAEVHASDIDPASVRCARRNLAPAGARVYEGDLFAPLPATLRGRVDVLAANVPYVPTDEIGLLPPEARLHEPRTALDGGPDGLDLARRVAACAPGWLAAGGTLLVEATDRQAPRVAEAFRQAGLAPRIRGCGDREATVVAGRSPA